MAFLNGTDPSLRQTRTPTVDTFLAGVGFTAGSSTTVTLSSDPGTENNVIISFDGIVQHRTEYSVSGTTVTFTAAIPAAVAAIEATYTTTIPAFEPADNSVTNAKMADNSVTNAKMADDAVGLAELSATGTPSSTTFLRGDNAWVAPAGGGWEFVSAVTASSSNSASLTGMASGYDYLAEAYDIIPASDNKTLYMQFGTGSTPTYQSTDYIFGAYGRFNNDLANSFNHENSHGNNAQVTVIPQNAGTSTNETVGFSIHIFNPSDTGSPTFFDGQGFGKTATTQAGVNDISGFYNADAAVTAVKFYFSGSANISQGKFFFYRRANA